MPPIVLRAGEFKPSDPFGLYRDRANPLDPSAPKPSGAPQLSAEELARQDEIRRAEEANAQVDAQYQQLETQQPGQFAVIDSAEYEAWRADWESRQPGWLEDTARILGGSIAKGGGAIVSGLGSAITGLTNATTTPVVNQLFGTNYGQANPLQAPADWLTHLGEKTQEGVSFATREAIEQSTPGGDLLDPSSWTLGEAPSAPGYAALALDVFGQMVPVIAAAVVAGPMGGAIVGGMQGGGAASAQAEAVIDQMAAEPGLLERESAYYREQIAAGASHEEALGATKAAAGQAAFWLTAPISGLGGFATSKIIDPATAIMQGKNIIARITGRAALSGLEEGVQEAAETIATNAGINEGAGTDLALTEGTFGDFLLGALAGGAPGAVAGAFTGGGQPVAPEAPIAAPTGANPAQVAPDVAPPAAPPAGPLTRAREHGLGQAPAAGAGAQLVVNDPALPGMGAGEVHGQTVSLSPNQTGIDPTMARVVLPDGAERVMGKRLLQTPEGVPLMPDPQAMGENLIVSNVSRVARPKAGERAIVEAPDLPAFNGTVEQYVEGESGTFEVIVTDDDGEVFQVPESAVRSLNLTRADIEAAQRQDEPPVEREPVPAAPDTRSIAGASMVFPNDTLAQLSDLGRERATTRGLDRAMGMTLDRLQAPDLNIEKVTELADKLGILPDRVNALADDYWRSTKEHAESANSALPQNMFPIDDATLAVWRAERANAPGLISSEGTEGTKAAETLANEPSSSDPVEAWWDRLTPGARKAALASAKVKRSEKSAWGQFSKPIKAKLAMVRTEFEAVDSARAGSRALDAAANEAATSPENDRTEPSQAQKEAGNYKLGHAKIGGLDLSIENPAGSERKGVDKGGKAWSVTMESHYGYIKGTVGKDKDHIDVFVKPGTDVLDDSAPVYVVDQVVDGKFDEHKVMLGFKNADEAREAYLENYAKGWQGLGGMGTATLAEFKQWLKSGDTNKPFGTLKATPGSPKAAEAGGRRVPAQAMYDLLREAGAVETMSVAVAQDVNQDVMAAKFAAHVDGTSITRDQTTLSAEGQVLHVSTSDGERFSVSGNKLALLLRDVLGSPERYEGDLLTAPAATAPEAPKPYDAAKELPAQVLRLMQASGTGVVEKLKVWVSASNADLIAAWRRSVGDQLTGMGGDRVTLQARAGALEVVMPSRDGSKVVKKTYAGGDLVKLIKAAIALAPAAVEPAPKTLANATAPEHAVIGVDDRELGQIVDEFNAAQKDMMSGEHPVSNVFQPPKKGEVVRLADKAKVFHKDHGWMTPAEARAKIDEWKAHARAQGADPSIRSANSDKVVLSLFDLSGEWSRPWEEAGYQVYRFDIQADPDVGDVNNFSAEFFGDWFGDFEGQDIYAILAACPCTDFAVSGARHFAAKDADGRTVASVKLVHQTLRTIEYFKPAVWALENPVGRIESLGGLPPWRLSFDPNHLGDTYTKKTLIWGRFNGDLPVAPVEPTEGSKMWAQYGGKSLATKNARSVTPEGFSYGFFMANNAHDHAAMALANKFDRLNRELIGQAIDAGVSPAAITEAVEDHYYMDLDDKAANEAIRSLMANDTAAVPEPDAEPDTPERPASPAASTAPDADRMSLARAVNAAAKTDTKKARALVDEAKRPEPAPAKIEDFGEELINARKHLVGEYRGKLDEAVDIGAEPLSISFPRPDYVKLAAAGITADRLAMIAVIRDMLPIKPRKSYKLAGWVAQVESARKLASLLLEGKVTPSDLVSRTGGQAASEARALNNTALAIEHVAPEQIEGAAKWRIRDGSYSVFNGVRHDPPKHMYYVEGPNGRTIFGNERAMAYDETVEGIIEKAGKLIDAALASDANKPKAEGAASRYTPVSVYRDRRTSEIAIGFKVNSSMIRIAGGFETPKAAREYVESNRDEVQGKIDELRKGPVLRNAENRDRVGRDMRGGDITPEQFSDAFGFRGVQFGNYVEGKRRQTDLNRAYDALMDLADVVGVPPRALSLEGALGLAFGARGNGGKNAAAAHYEPGLMVINLTKGGGPGSLAHEWLHALDNYFGRQDGTGGYISQSKRQDGQVRPEVFAAWKAIEEAITSGVTTKSEFLKRALEADKTRSKPYYSTTIELAARSFERYVVDRLDEKGVTNDYLANINLDGGAYPTSDEMLGGIQQAYDQLFNVLEHKETEKGVRLYSEAREAPAGWGEVENLAEGLTESEMAELTKIVQKVSGLSDVKWHDRVRAIGGSVEWGTTADIEAAGYYSPGLDVVGLTTQWGNPKTAYHEAFHRLQWMFLTEQEQKLLAGEEGSLRKMLKGHRPDEQINRMWPSEVEAEAFGLWASGVVPAPKAGSLAEAWQKVKDVLSRAVNYLLGLGYQVPTDIFAAAKRGDIADRAPIKRQKRPSGNRAADTPRTVRTIRKQLRSGGLGTMVDALEQVDRLRIIHSDDAETGMDGVQGFTDPDGTITLIADQIIGDPVAVLLHEAFHSGASELLGTPAWRKLMVNLAGLYRQFEQSKGSARKFFDAARERVAAAEASAGALTEPLRVEEFAAYAIEEQASAPAALSKWVDELLGTLKAWALKRFGRQLGAITPGQLKAIAKYALIEAVGSPSSPTAMASRRRSIADVGARAKSAITLERIAEEIGGRLTDLKPTALATIPLNYFSELKRPGMVAVDQYLKVKRLMDAYRGNKHAAIDVIAQEWRKYARLGFGGADAQGRSRAAALADLMHETTLAGIDPSATSEEMEAKPGYAALRARYLALPRAGQDLYRKVRDAYRDQADELDAILLDNVRKTQEIAFRRAEDKYREKLAEIEGSKLSAQDQSKARHDAEQTYRGEMARATANMKARMTKLRLVFESSRVPAPYFPLARFGKYFVTVKDVDGTVMSFTKRETDAERQRLQQDMQRAYPNAKVESGLMEEKGSSRDMMDPRIVAEIEALLGDQGVDAKVMDAVWQRYLETMPDLSARKRFIHRKGVAGFDGDALKTFASNQFHAAHQMARLKYGLELTELTNQAVDQAKKADDQVRGMQLANELRKRHEWVLNPTGSRFVQGITQTMFVWYLAGSPAAALVNMSQTPMMAIPILGARLGGIGKATVAIGKASADVVRGKGSARNASLTDDEKRAMEAFYESGLIDRTQAHDLAGVGETGLGYSPWRHKLMSFISWAYHNVEVWNREVTALAAYRMSRELGMHEGQAIDLAHDLTWRSHFDYSNSSRPRFMQSDFAKVALTFQSHQVNMWYRLFRDIHQSVKGQSAQARKEARYQLAGILGMMSLFGGMTGFFGYNVLVAIAGLAFDDDDDPRSFKAEIEGSIVDLLGADIGGMVLKGVPGHLTGIDLTTRLGMPDFFVRAPDSGAEGRDWFQELIIGSLGVFPSTLISGVDGFGLMMDGKVIRGAEVLAPKAIKDLFQMARYWNEGVLTRNGDVVLEREQLNALDMFIEGMGFTPAKVAETYERMGTLKDAEQHVLDERRALMNRFALAVMTGDAEAKRSAIEAIKQWNRKPYARAVPITSDGLGQSLKSRARNANKREDGVLIADPELGKLIRELMPAHMTR